MPKSRNLQVPQTVLDGANDLSIRFYLADAAATPPNHPRVAIELVTIGGERLQVDRPVSDFSSLSGAQKTALRAALLSLRDEALLLDGFA